MNTMPPITPGFKFQPTAPLIAALAIAAERRMAAGQPSEGAPPLCCDPVAGEAAPASRALAGPGEEAEASLDRRV